MRRGVARIGVGADGFEAEGPKPVVDYSSRGFPSISVAPIGLAQPITERGLFTAVTCRSVETHAADQTIGFLQRDSKAMRPSGRVVLLHASDPLMPVGFGVGIRNVLTQRAISQLPASATRSARSSSRYDRTRSRAVSITTPDDPVAAPATSSFDRFAKAPSPRPATLAQEALAPRLGLTLDADRGQRTLHAMTCRLEAGYPKLSSPGVGGDHRYPALQPSHLQQSIFTLFASAYCRCRGVGPSRRTCSCAARRGESEIYDPILFWAELSSRLTLHGTTLNLAH